MDQAAIVTRSGAWAPEPGSGRFWRSGRVYGQGVQPGLEFGGDRPIYSPVPGHAGEASEGWCADMDAVMRLARGAGARMAAMQFGFIGDFKLGR